MHGNTFNVFIISSSLSCPVDIGNSASANKALWSFALKLFLIKRKKILFLQVRLGKNGVEEVLGLGPLSDYEKETLESLKPELLSSIEKGIKFANQS